jgi:chromosome segregation protein
MLKSLELFGFKSFADRTTFEFAEGVTCVVGPNGSGKSNVVDALKWILGDQSAKSLRGKEMSDVIFNGSAGRKPSNFAEATLTFDNSSGLLPIASAEVQIGRRLYTSGDSEYLLNRNAVRLKDIREMFMGTGAGTAAYSIIEQGRVDQILQANPTTRRVVFEEAAGISRFKARRVEAQRRLERVDQNLLRLRDIVDQLESRLNATRSQASKAAKYREYSTEYRALWIGLAADDYRAAAAQLEQLQAELDQHQRSMAATDGELTAREKHLAEFDAQASQLDQQIRQLERRRSSGREAIAGHESAIRHQTTQSRELAAEIQRLRSQRNTLRGQLLSVSVEFEQTTRRLSNIETDFERQQEALQQRELRIVELRERLDAARETIAQQRRRREQLQQKQSGCEQQQESLRIRLNAVDEAAQQAADEATELIERIADSDAEREARQSALHAADQEVAAAQARIDHARQARRQLQSEHGAGERKLARWREERSARTARRQLLEDMEARNEGLNIGVREILHLAGTSNQPPWSLIRGNVGDLLQAELDDAPLLEVALGSRVQLLVIDDLGPMVEFLSTAFAEVAGRVGFLELQGTLCEAPASTIDLCDQAGVMTRADKLVSSSKVPGLAERLLADTWIVESLEVSYRLARGAGRGCRFVTLQGELLECDGTLYVGNSPHESAVISRKSELRLLRTEIRDLVQRIERAEAELEALDASLVETDSELAELHSQLSSRMANLADRRSEHAAQIAECDRLGESRQALDARIERLAAERSELEAGVAELQQQMQENARQVEHLRVSVEDAETAAAAIEAHLREQQQQTKSEQLELAKHEERLSALQSNHLRLEEDRRQRQRQVEQADAHLIAARRKEWEVTAAILSARAQLAELFVSDDAWLAEVRVLQSERDELRSRRRRLQQEQDKLRDRRRDLTDQIHQLEMHSRDLRHSISSLNERILEEFSIELSEAVEEGASAYQEWIAPVDEEDSEDDAATSSQVDVRAAEPADETDVESETAVAGGQEGASGGGVLSPIRPSFEDVRDEIENRVERLRRKIRNLGSINDESLKDLDELENRFADLSGQLADLEAAKDTLEDIIRRINAESRRLFLETFESIRVHFQELYRKLFGGGEGDIVLEDPDDVLECGIDIVARPPGKELRSISLLSGGEKTMTAVALLFAMFKSKPSPYCILDEVDAALDEANVDRYVSVVKEFRASTQFVIITHRKRTMTAADRLYGVTMEQAGVSKRLNVEFEDVSDDGHFRTTGKAAA